MSTTQYGIGVTKNRYELFDIDDRDPLEILKSHEEEKEARKKTKLSEKENKGKEIQKAKNNTRKGIKETQNLKLHDVTRNKDENKGNAVPRSYDRNDRKFNNDSREDKNNRRNRGDAEFHREEKAVEKDRKGGRDVVNNGGNTNFNEIHENGPGGRGSGGGGMQRTGRTGPRGGLTMARGAANVRGARGVAQNTTRGSAPFETKGKQRDFEKLALIDKPDQNNIPTQSGDDTPNFQEKIDSEDAAQNNGPVSTNTEIVEPCLVRDEERKELTLDEWKAMKAPRQKPTYNLRKAGEGEDLSQWKKMYALQKKKDGDDDDDDDEYEYESCEYPQRVGRQKHVLDIDIHFKDTRSVGRNRGGRLGARGGSRIGIRAGQPGPPVSNSYSEKDKYVRDLKAPKVDDEHDFPSLG